MVILLILLAIPAAGMARAAGIRNCRPRARDARRFAGAPAAPNASC